MATLSGRMRDSGSLVREKSVNLLDSYVPPSQRQEYFDSIRSWAAVNPKLADASNGMVDLNAAAEHISKRVADAMPQSADEPASDKRAREYLARQALGIPENYESSANGSGSYPQRHQGTAYLNLKDDPHVQSAVRPHTDGDQVAQAAPQFGSKPQAVP
ncbi:MAG: hypothetical protein Q9162_005513 [Coniocarpon cinnabarinum]